MVTNASMKICYDRVDAIDSIEEINEYIKDLEDQAYNDPFPDDDLAGDIFLSSLLDYARKRKKEIEGD